MGGWILGKIRTRGKEEDAEEEEGEGNDEVGEGAAGGG